MFYGSTTYAEIEYGGAGVSGDLSVQVNVLQAQFTFPNPVTRTDSFVEVGTFVGEFTFLESSLFIGSVYRPQTLRGVFTFPTPQLEIDSFVSVDTLEAQFTFLDSTVAISKSVEVDTFRGEFTFLDYQVKYDSVQEVDTLQAEFNFLPYELFIVNGRANIKPKLNTQITTPKMFIRDTRVTIKT